MNRERFRDLLIAAFFTGFVLFAFWLGQVISKAPQPTERCFTNNLTQQQQCRVQLRWSASDD